MRVRIFGLESDSAGQILKLLPEKLRPKIPCRSDWNGIITLADGRALRILATCFYFLKTSREKARLALEFGATRPGPGRGKKISDEDFKKQAAIAAKLSDLNHGRK